MSTTTTATIPTGTYTIDPTHSRIGFVARHAMVTKVRGSFNEFEGSGSFDAENPAAAQLQLTIQAASIDTRNADRDGHLRVERLLRHGHLPGDQLRVDRSRAERRRRVPGHRGPHASRVSPSPSPSTSSTPAQPSTPTATPASGSTARPPSTARTGASTGTPPSKPAASSSARRSPWSSTCLPFAAASDTSADAHRSVNR